MVTEWIKNRKQSLDQLVLHKSISDYFAMLPESSQSALMSELENQISPILKTYAHKIGAKPVDYVLSLRYNDQMKKQTKTLAKSESLFRIVELDAKNAWDGITNLIVKMAQRSNNEDLIKSLRNAAIGLGLLGALGSVPETQSAQTDIIPHAFHSKFKAPDFGSQKEDNFLHNVMQLESSGGKNTNHATIDYGKYKGQTAMGRWGLLPTTIREMARKKTMAANPDVTKVNSMNDSQLKDYITHNPDIETHIARSLARHVLGRFKTPQKAAYAWKYGHNLSPASIGPQQIQNKYVQDFNQLNSGKSIRGLIPGSPSHSIAMGKSEEYFPLRLEKWLKKRHTDQQNSITRTMEHIGDRAEKVKPPKNEDPAQGLDLKDPLDRIKLAVRKVNE